MRKVFYRYFKKFLPDNRGIALPLVGIMGFLLIGFGGVVADYGRAQVAQSRMQASLDAGTLAAAKHIPDPPVAVVEVRKYFDTNYNDFMDTIILDFQANVNGNALNTSAEGQINTWIMQIFGMRTLDFTANSAVELNVTDTEIVFVLDNTGSMNAENMPVLKTSMTRFLNRFYADPLMAGNLYIGLVPFANSVNISPIIIYGDPRYGTAVLLRVIRIIAILRTIRRMYKDF
jgi:Putative Flp pilus-assembly TadE/G-like